MVHPLIYIYIRENELNCASIQFENIYQPIPEEEEICRNWKSKIQPSGIYLVFELQRSKMLEIAQVWLSNSC